MGKGLIANITSMSDLIERISPYVLYVLTKLGRAEYLNETMIVVQIIFGTQFIYIILRIIKYLYKKYNDRQALNDLQPFVDSEQLKNITEYYVPTKAQNVSPSNENEPGDVFATTARIELLPFYLKNVVSKSSAQRLYLVLADSGMGKSTFLVNLCLAINAKGRRSSVQAKFIPLGHPLADEEIANQDRTIQKKTVLLLDAFDEDARAQEDHEGRLDDLLKRTAHYRAVILTCRTQFFSSEAEEPFSTKLYRFNSQAGNTHHKFKKMYISPFDEDDINRFLGMKYGRGILWTSRKRKLAKKFVMLCPNLMVRPMLLSYIDYLTAGPASIQDIPKTASDAYSALVKHWIDREANRVDEKRRESFIHAMNDFSLNLALNIFMNRNKRDGLYIPADEILTFARGFNIELDEIELKGKSLLNRDSEGRYKFSHKSILEFLLARMAVEDAGFAQGVYYFIDLDGFDQARRFYSEMDNVHTTGAIGYVFDASQNRYTILRKRDDEERSELYRIMSASSEPMTPWKTTRTSALLELERKIGITTGVQLPDNIIVIDSFQDKMFNRYFIAKRNDPLDLSPSSFAGYSNSGVKKTDNCASYDDAFSELVSIVGVLERP